MVPGKDVEMNIEVYTSIIINKDDFTLSLGHSLKGIYEDITGYLLYEISEDKDGENRKYYRKMWKIDITLSYPFSGDLGHLILSIGDSHSGAITTTRPVIGEEKTLVKPFFDPVPRSVQTYPGQDVFINTLVNGYTPIKVINILN